MRKKHSLQRLFNQDISPSCAYCRNNLTPSGEPTCRLGRSFPDSGECKGFLYDPLLREPKVRPAPAAPEPKDLKLD